MANDYLVSKWRNWFGFFYQSQEGKICYADMETARSKFTSLHNLEGKQKQKSFDAFTKWWTEYVMLGKQEITVDEFIEKQNAAFKANKKALAARMLNCQEALNDLIGLSENGFVTEDDILIISEAVGQVDKEKNRKSIQEFGSNRNKIPIKEMIEMWTHYLTSEDSSVPDLCQKAMAKFNPY